MSVATVPWACEKNYLNLRKTIETYNQIMYTVYIINIGPMYIYTEAIYIASMSVAIIPWAGRKNDLKLMLTYLILKQVSGGVTFTRLASRFVADPCRIFRIPTIFSGLIHSLSVLRGNT